MPSLGELVPVAVAVYILCKQSKYLQWVETLEEDDPRTNGEISEKLLRKWRAEGIRYGIDKGLRDRYPGIAIRWADTSQDTNLVYCTTDRMLSAGTSGYRIGYYLPMIVYEINDALHDLDYDSEVREATIEEEREFKNGN